MFKQLFDAHFPGYMVIKTDLKKIANSLFKEHSKNLSRSITSIAFPKSLSDNKQEFHKIFSRYVDTIEIIVSANGITKKQDGSITASYISMAYMIPNEEEIFSITEAASGITYTRRERIGDEEFKEASNVPERHKDLQKLLIKFFKESGVIIKN